MKGLCFFSADVKGSFTTTQSLGNEIGDKEHRFGLHVVYMDNRELKIWENVYFYLMIQDECHNIHFLVNTDDGIKIIAADGTLKIPTLHRAPLRRYFPTPGNEFMLKIEVNGSFGAPYLDLNDLSALQENRLHAAYPGYSFFEKAFWSNVQEFGVRFRSGKPWMSWDEQYPQTKPGNVHIVKRKYNDGGAHMDRRMAVFDPFTQDDVGLYETRLSLGLRNSIEVRIYSELTVSGSSKSEFANYPALSYLPCDLYPSMVDTELQEIHPDGQTLNLGVAKPAIHAGATWVCLLELSPKKSPLLLLEDDNKGSPSIPMLLAGKKHS
jgi:hypothetical protein